MKDAGHLDDIVLERYAMNTLSELEAEQVEDHISLCANCLNRLDEESAFLRDIRQTLSAEPATPDARPVDEKPSLTRPAGIWGWLHWGTPAWAGAACLLAVATFFVLRPAPIGPVASVALESTRGESVTVHGTGPFDFQMFVPESAEAYQVILVDSGGATVWSSNVASNTGTKDGKLHAIVRKTLSPGQYFVRVSDPSSQAIHEYGVSVER
jgi:hypothetical protein